MNAAIGSTMRNSQRQDRNCKMTPEMVGPRAGATEMTTVTTPMVCPRRATGTRTSTVVISNGIMTAVPQACTTRPTISMVKPGARPAISVPRQNVLMAPMKICRVVKRCWMNPVVGMTTAMVSRNPVATHWAVRALIPRSSISTGSATDMIVSFKITTNAEHNSRPMTSLLREPSPGVAELSSVTVGSAMDSLVSSATALRYPPSVVTRSLVEP